MNRTMSNSTPRLVAADVDIPRIGLGTFGMDSDQATHIVETALDVGYRHIDTAILYENEGAVGAGMKGSGVPRDQIFLTTKIPRTHASATDAPRAARESLNRLGLDYVDLLLLHWPNDAVPPEETFEALVPLVESGEVRALGMSNANTSLVRQVLKVTALANIQVEHHPYLPQEALLDLVAEEGMTLTAYSPFAQGRVFSDPVLNSIGAKHNKSAGQVALRWILDKPRTVVIPKTATASRLGQNLAIQDFELDPEDVARIDALGAERFRIFDPPFPVTWDDR
jgi:2,5-diketo-D-gluconate reductase B